MPHPARTTRRANLPLPILRCPSTRYQVPDVDVYTPEGVDRQRYNVERFRRRQQVVVAGCAIVAASIAFGQTAFGEDQDGITVALFFQGMLMMVFGVFRLRCPNCGDAPANSASFADRSYRQGVNPLPKRCMTCGCFLSRKALQGALDGD